MMATLTSRLTGEVLEAVGQWPSVFESTVDVSDEPAFINGQRAISGSYAVPDRQHLIRPIGIVGMPEIRVPDKSIIDDDHSRSICKVMDGLTRAFNESTTTWDDWTAVSPVMPGISEKADILPLDDEIRNHLPAIVDICRRPHHNLVHELERVPVSRAKRTPPRAAGFLAAHPEDWAQPTLSGPRPKRILAEVTDESLDMFENRVVARLVDICGRYLARRIRELRRLIMLYEEVFDMEELLTSHWARQNRLYSLLAELFNEEHRLQVTQQTLETITTIRYRILGLTDSQLYREVPRRALVAPVLPATNILVNDPRYRRVSDLWRTVFSRTDEQQSPDDIHRRTVEAFEGFDLFVLLLVVQACTRCGALADERTELIADHEVLLHDPFGGQFSVVFRSSSRCIELLAGEKKLRIVPLFCSIGELAPEDQDALVEYLTERCRTIKDEIVFVYPDALQHENGPVAYAERRLAALRHELPADERLSYSLLPVSPWRVGSLDDIGRAINWFLLEQRFRSIPPKVQVPAKIANIVHQWPHALRDTMNREVWAVLTPSVLPELKHAMAKEKEMMTLRVNEIQSELDQLNTVRKAHKGRRNGSDALRRSRQHVQQLKAELPQAEAYAAHCQRLLDELDEAEKIWQIAVLCPVCGGKEVRREKRNDGFWSVCSGCQAEWGTQRCAFCHEVKPCIKPYSESWAQVLKAGHSAIRVAGADLLSAPALDSKGCVVFCCPSCGRSE